MPRDARGSSTVVGSVLLVAVVTVLAAVVGAAALGVAGATGGGSQSDAAAGIADGATVPTALGLEVRGDRVTLVHRAGAALDVKGLRLRIAVDEEELAHQPPVPFFAARGFRAGPTGPFNTAASPRWTAGERASLRVAGTNAPALKPGARVEVEVYEGSRRVAALTTRAQAA
jgi:hypothetical protein